MHDLCQSLKDSWCLYTDKHCGKFSTVAAPLMWSCTFESEIYLKICDYLVFRKEPQEMQRKSVYT